MKTINPNCECFTNDPPCNEQHLGLMCTRSIGHSGNHIACETEACNVMEWPQVTGEQLRDEGMSQVSDSVAKGFWIARFNLRAGLILKSEGQVSSDEVVSKMEKPPGNPNLVGACMRAFAVKNNLVPVGMTKSKSPSRHAGRAMVWGRK